MRQLPELAVDDTQIFDDIAAAKRQPTRGCLQGIRPAVLAAYDDYSASVPEIGDLPAVNLSAAQRAALIHAFEVETVPLAKLRRGLLDRVLAARCPFCGLSESSTLDHYLPKELNPQFAILAKNLVPCCSPCNTRKRHLVLDEETGIRLFLHPYFDDVPLTRFLRVDVRLLQDALSVTYRIHRSAGMTQPTFQRLRSHFRLLGLADRYRVMSLEDLRGRYQALSRLYSQTEDAERVSAFLLQEADDYEAGYGVNHWRAVLYRALADDDEFCDGGFEALKVIQ
jgi:hypothetical protein